MSGLTILAVRPVVIRTDNREDCVHYLSMTPATLIRLHEERGLPISWPGGRGRGKSGLISLKLVEQWMAGEGIFGLNAAKKKTASVAKR